MSEYGFDYLNERIDLLEATRSGGRRGRLGYNPEQNFAVLDPAFNKIYEFIGDTIKQGGKSELGGEEIDVVGKGDKRHRYRQLQFALLIIMELGEDENFIDYDQDGDTEEYEMESSIKRFCKNILGLDPSISARRQGIADNLTLMSKALTRIVSGKGSNEENTALIQPYHQYLKTEEFKEKATDVNEILNYSETSRVASSQAYNAAMKREGDFGRGHKDIDRIQVEAIPLVSAINRAQTAEKKRHNPLYAEKLAEQGRSNEVSDSFIDDTYMLIDALDNLIDIKQGLKEDLQGKNINASNKDAIFEDIADTAIRTGEESDAYILSPEELQALYFTDTDELFSEIRQFLEKAKDQGGVELEDYQADMGKKRREIPEFAGVLNAYIKEIDGIRAANQEVRELFPDTPEATGPRYRGYNDQILDMFLKTDEDRKLFDDWYDIESKKRIMALDRLGQKIKLLARRDSGVDDPYLSKGEMNQFRRGVQSFDDKRSGKAPAPRPSGPVAPKKVPTKKAPVAPKKSSPQPEEDEEDMYDVMDYMTEQVIKDERTHPRGEFKDRGFKKVRSYAEWLWLNQDK